MKGFETGFEAEWRNGFFCETVKVVEAGAGRACRHAFAPSVRRHSGGQLLLTCRWDASGSAEGDASNEQALFFSRDDGAGWTMANDGKPILTWENGSGFAQRSAITHSFVFEDNGGTTWLYYTVNQPYTWGAGRPDRATGGGEIRRLPIAFDGTTWRPAAAAGDVVWGFMQPLDNGRGGAWDNVRALSLNDIVRTRRGTLLLPVAGRATVPEPDGAFWRLNRCWVLESEDDGRTWSRSYFIGGGDGLCLCEPTMVETAEPGHLVCYMRVQYDTGRQLYRSESRDWGRTWSRPEPAGLPNTAFSGTKPFLRRLADGTYLLLQTNEHSSSDRTNISVFVSDEERLKRNVWPLVKVLTAAECRGHWEGACYGWLEDAGGGRFYAAYVGFTAERSAIHFARLDLDWLRGSVAEPVSGYSLRGDRLPALTDRHARTGQVSVRFAHTGGRLQFTRISEATEAAGDRPVHVRLYVCLRRAPRSEEFRLLHAAGDNGSQTAFELALRPALNAHLWVLHNGGWLDTGLRCPEDRWFEVAAAAGPDLRFRLRVDGREIRSAGGGPLYIRTTERPDTMWIGGPLANREDCDIYVDDIYYGSGEREEEDHG